MSGHSVPKVGRASLLILQAYIDTILPRWEACTIRSAVLVTQEVDKLVESLYVTATNKKLIAIIL